MSTQATQTAAVTPSPSCLINTLSPSCSINTFSIYTLGSTFKSSVKSAEVDVKIINLATNIFKLLRELEWITPTAGIAFLFHAEPFAKVGEFFTATPSFADLRKNAKHTWAESISNKAFAILDVMTVNSFLDDMGVPSLSLIVDTLGKMPILHQFFEYAEGFPVVNILLFVGNAGGLIQNLTTDTEKANKEKLFGLVRDQWARKSAALAGIEKNEKGGAEGAHKAEVQEIDRLLVSVKSLSKEERAEIVQLTQLSWDGVFEVSSKDSSDLAVEKKKFCANQLQYWSVATNEAWKNHSEGRATIVVNTLRIVNISLKAFAIGTGAPIMIFGVFVASLALTKTIAFSHYYKGAHNNEFKAPEYRLMPLKLSA